MDSSLPFLLSSASTRRARTGGGGGQVTPDELVLDAATGAVRERRTGDKAVMTVRTPDGPAERPVEDDRRRTPVLDDASAAELATLRRRIAAHYGRPMDVEWTSADGTFAIVQARPITGLRDPWNDSRSGDYLWTNPNLDEAIPDVMTPSTWSLVQLFMSRAMPTLSLPGFRGYGNIGGRFYLNMSLSAAMSGLVGISESRFRSLTENTFGRLPAGVAIPRSRCRGSRCSASSCLLPCGSWPTCPAPCGGCPPSWLATRAAAPS